MSKREERFGSCSACEGASLIQDRFQRFFQHFKSTLTPSESLSIESYKNVYFWMSAKLTLEELGIFLKCRETFAKS